MARSIIKKMANQGNREALGYLPLSLTTTFVLSGAFSRFTHGKYIPQYYAYQEYHRPDDGGIEAQIIPLVDTALGMMLLLRRTRFLAAVVVDIFMILGLVVQVSAGKGFGGDIIMVAIATGTVVQAWKM